MSVPHQTFRLDNGMTVVLVPDPALPKVIVDLWYDVGSFDDPPGRSGFAHLFEHLMFKGTARVGAGEFDRAMEELGGSNNASTADERTNYYDLGPKGALDLFLWLEADRMTGLARRKHKRPGRERGGVAGTKSGSPSRRDRSVLKMALGICTQKAAF